MPQGDKSSYTPKQKRQARHIEDSARRRGRSSRSAARIAWATVNKQDGGGKKRGGRSGRSRSGGSRTRTRRSPGARRAANRRPTRSRSRTARTGRTRRVRSLA